MDIEQVVVGPTATHREAVTDRFEATSGKVQLSGLQALVRLLVDQVRLDRAGGARPGVFISGYEGSPLAGLDLELSRQNALLQRHDIVFKPAVNEELAAAAVQGSQIASASAECVRDGVVGVWYGKAPGLDRATDAIRHSNLAGTDRRGGVLALVGDDSIAKSSTVPSSSEAAIAELGLPCLSPSSPGEILDYGLHGIAMSRASGLWVALKLATNVVDGSETVSLDPADARPVEPDRVFDGEEFSHSVTGRLLQPVLGEIERSQSRERMEMARRYARVNNLNRVMGDPDATLGIVCAGATYLDVREALAKIGIPGDSLQSSGVRILKLGVVHPLEPTIVAEFAHGLTEILVIEEKKAFIELALKDLLYGTQAAPRIHGKRDEAGNELFRSDGDLPPDYLAPRIASRVRQHGGSARVNAWLEAQESTPQRPRLLPILPRTPAFCSGCPHSVSTRVPAGSLVGGGIGCHAMTTFMPSERVGESIGLAAMGVEGSAWTGMAPFVARRHLFQNLGDGTFHHSGSLAIRHAIASGANMTYKLLYNDTVAMTGGQDPIGKMSVPRIVQELLAEGVARIAITSDDPKRTRRSFGMKKLPEQVSIHGRETIIDVQEDLAKLEGVSVLIHEQECATELRRKRKRGKIPTPNKRIAINARVCEGCGDCGDKSGCLSVQPIDTEFGRKTRIDQGSCNMDFTCTTGDCPSFVEVTRPQGSPAPAKASGRASEEIDPSSLTEPASLAARDGFNMRIAGVGGTGVVTIAQVVAAAASHAGLESRGLDQLGLAQKGGAVVSDIRLSSEPMTGSNKIDSGGCDLLLGCDILVAAQEANLSVIAPDRTTAVISTSVTATSSMVTDPRISFPETSQLVSRLERGGQAGSNFFVDARAETERHRLGDSVYANVFLLGVATQLGALPLKPADLEWALESNGVQVAANLRAFRLGRRFVLEGDGHGREVVRSGGCAHPDLAGIVRADKGSRLSRTVETRVDELVAYQNADYARQFGEKVERVRSMERTRLGSTTITEEYARQLFKVMAYKDEYEVARLHADPAYRAQLREEFGPDAEISYLLHPPVLRALGMDQKIRLRGRWGVSVLRLLYGMRFTRGTVADVFGHADMRKQERALIADYVDAVDAAMSNLTVDNADTVHELVGLPEWIRGYEDIKSASIERYYQRRTELMSRLSERGKAAHRVIA